MKKSYVYMPYIMESTVPKLRVYDLMRITHLNIAFALIREGAVTVDHLQYLSRLEVYKRINPQLKLILSIGGWQADGFSQAAETEAGRALFARTALQIVVQWGFDGIDIDWEYPCSSQAGIASSPDDKENFTALMRVLRDALDAQGRADGKRYLLTCAVGAGQYFVDGSQMDQVSRLTDYVNLMTYDMRGGFTHTAGHHTNLYPQAGDPEGPSATATVELFHRAGVPYEKMVLGSAFYGRMWTGVAPENHGLGQPAASSGGYLGHWDLQDSETMALRGFTRYWDPSAQAAWYWNGQDFISFEDPASLQAKCAYIREKGLAGLMYWVYGNHTLFEIPARELMGF